MQTKKSFKSLLKSLTQNANNSSGTLQYVPPIPAPYIPQQKQTSQAAQAYATTTGTTTYQPGSVVWTTNIPSYTIAVSGMSSSGGGWPGHPDPKYWPWFEGNMPKQERELIKDFKSRHPDFDTLQDEINLITTRKPGLLNTPLFITLIYELAKDIKKLLDNYTDPDKIEDILDGKTKETPG